MTSRELPTSVPSNVPLNSHKNFSYTGRELEAMSWAINYHRWILEIFRPYLGQHIVEVGAGFGSFSELILSEHDFQTLSLVEPSQNMYEHLSDHVRKSYLGKNVETYHGTFIEAAPIIRSQKTVDSILYVNVLEHIADDQRELEAVRETLSNSGHVFLFVPALSWLYGPFDRRVGHIRRYTKSEVEDKLLRTGFKIVRSAYFDFPGIVSWWFKYRVMKSATMENGAVKFYDRFIIPPVRWIETRIPPPIGKNVLAIAQKR